MRIVSLLPSTTEILFAIGAGDDVVGVTFECDYPPEARERRIVSTSALPEGLDAQVDEAGRGFSGGQRARLALARAVLADSDVLVLVEPTSSVDAHTEVIIAARLQAARHGDGRNTDTARTTVVTSASPLRAGSSTQRRRLLCGASSIRTARLLWMYSTCTRRTAPIAPSRTNWRAWRVIG